MAHLVGAVLVGAGIGAYLIAAFGRAPDFEREPGAPAASADAPAASAPASSSAAPGRRLTPAARRVLSAQQVDDLNSAVFGAASPAEMQAKVAAARAAAAAAEADGGPLEGGRGLRAGLDLCAAAVLAAMVAVVMRTNYGVDIVGAVGGLFPQEAAILADAWAGLTRDSAAASARLADLAEQAGELLK